MSEHDDIQELLDGILEDAPLPPAASTAVNQEQGDTAEAVFKKPDVFAETEETLLQDAVDSMNPDMLEKAGDGESLLEATLEGIISEDEQPQDSLVEPMQAMAGFDATMEAIDPDAVPAPPAPPTAPPVPQVQVQAPTFATEDIANAIDIRNYGTLVTLQTSRWSAKVKDRQAAKAAADASGADAKAFEAVKHLLVGADEKLKRIHRAIDLARTEHYRLTLPWSTVSAGDTGKRTGGRLLPNTLFMEYTTAMAKCKQEMDDAIADFVPSYPALIQVAQTRLGSRFDPAEYPNASAIAQHFGLTFDFVPVPIGTDFQGLADAQIAKLANSLAKRTVTMLENAMQDTWTRLYELVSHAAEKLGDPDKMFHYTMVDKLRDIVKLLKHLNATGDQRIEDIRAFVEKHLTMHEVKEIRKDEALRKTLAGHATEAKKMMEEAS